MHRTVTLAIVGRGHWGQVYRKSIAALASQLPHGDVRTIALPDDCIFGRDYKTGLERARARGVDGVIVACSTRAHYDVAIHLLTHGFRNLLIEKPLVETPDQAQRLLALLTTMPGARVVVGHTLLYDPAYRTMRELTPTTIGRVTEIHYTSLKAPRIEDETIIPDAGSPSIYLFLDAADSTPTTITVRPTERDNLELTLEFANGVRGVARIGTDYPERIREIALIGERGRLIVNEFMDPRTLRFIGTHDAATPIRFPTEHTSLQLELLHFANCITGRAAPRTSVAAGADVVHVIARAIESFQRHGVPIPCTVPALPA